MAQVCSISRQRVARKNQAPISKVKAGMPDTSLQRHFTLKTFHYQDTSHQDTSHQFIIFEDTSHQYFFKIYQREFINLFYFFLTSLLSDLYEGVFFIKRI